MIQPQQPTPVQTEIAAMRRIATTLDALDADTRRRVVGWLAERYTPADVGGQP